MNTPKNEIAADEQPPILSSWNQLYAVVLFLHSLIIALFYWFTQVHS